MDARPCVPCPQPAMHYQDSGLEQEVVHSLSHPEVKTPEAWMSPEQSTYTATVLMETGGEETATLCEAPHAGPRGQSVSIPLSTAKETATLCEAPHAGPRGQSVSIPLSTAKYLVGEPADRAPAAEPRASSVSIPVEWGKATLIDAGALRAMVEARSRPAAAAQENEAAFTSSSSSQHGPEAALSSSSSSQRSQEDQPPEAPREGDTMEAPQPPSAEQRCAPAGSQQPPPATVFLGAQVEYYSNSHGTWLPTSIVKVDDETGDVWLDIKPDKQVSLEEQCQRLRARSQPTDEQLAWVASVLREGRLEEEGRPIFSKYATMDERKGQLGIPPAAMREAGLALDSKLGRSGQLCALRQHHATLGGESLSASGFNEVLWELLWQVEKEFGESLRLPAPHIAGNPWGTWQFEVRMAESARGTLNSVTHKVTGEQRALRMVSTLGDEARPRDLELEIENFRRLDHPHIAKLYAHYEDSGKEYLVMDAQNADSDLRSMFWHRRVTQRPFPEAFVQDMLRQVMLAVAYMHGKGVVHLDIRLGNIFVMPGTGADDMYRPATAAASAGRPHALVTGLSKARLFQPGGARYACVHGNGRILAPEVWRGEITPKADIFACGVALFELLALENPFMCPDDCAKALEYWARQPELSWELVKNRSTIATGLLAGMVDMDRVRRPSAAQCVQADFLKPDWSAGTEGPELPAALDGVLQQIASAPKRSVLYRSVALSIAAACPANQMPTIRHLFLWFDKDFVGRLRKDELQKDLETVGFSEVCAREASEALDFSRDGYVEWTEFVASCIQLGAGAYESHLKQLFQEADSDGDGLLSRQDIAGMLAAKHRCSGAVDAVFVDMVGRTEEGARVDWPTFLAHFRPASEQRPPEPAPAVDFLTQARALFGRVREALWPEDQPAEEPEEVRVQRLVDMGFTNRERCTAVLRKYRGRTAEARAIEELLRDARACTPGPAGL